MPDDYIVPDHVKQAIENAEQAAAEKCAAVFRENLKRKLKPFQWVVPKLTPDQVARSARLQERDTLRRFIDLDFRPESSKEPLLLASFKVTPPKGEELIEAANHVTLESSTGTWTDVQTETSYTLSLAGTVYFTEPEVEGRAGHVKVAYPLPLFEPGSVSQLLSCIAGNIMAMKAVERIKLMDFMMPQEYIESFPGPRFGIEGIRKTANVFGHTLVGTIIKPKTGLFPHEYTEALGNTFEYACVVKDDENLTHQSFCPFNLRAYLCYEKMNEIEGRLAERGIHEHKIYLPNVTTSDAGTMLHRAFYVHELGARACMIDIITAGFTAVQTLRNLGPPLVLHGHRAMHAAFARTPDHGVDMMAIAKCCRLAGIDELHIGTVVGKMEGGEEEVLNYHNVIRQEDFTPEVPEDSYCWYFPQKWYGMKPVMSVNSGGLYPKHLITLKELFGVDTITTMGGGIHGYGTLDGAWGARLAAEAAAKGHDIQYIKDNYDQVVEELGFKYPKPKEEAMVIIIKLLAGKDWKAMAFSDK